MASGSLLTKIWKGLHEMKALGLVDDVRTKINGAQAEGCSPISTAFKAGRDFFKPVKPKTIAKSLAIGNPADGYYALKATAESQGSMDMVSDEEVVEAIKLLAQTEGIFAETAGGVTIGVLQKLVKQGTIKKSDVTVAYITGNGLKTQEAVDTQACTIVEMIDTLNASHPGIKDRLCDDSGELRRFVNIYVNEEDIRFLKGKETSLKDGDEVSIVPAIAGGTSCRM